MLIVIRTQAIVSNTYYLSRRRGNDINISSGAIRLALSSSLPSRLTGVGADHCFLRHIYVKSGFIQANSAFSFEMKVLLVNDDVSIPLQTS